MIALLTTLRVLFAPTVTFPEPIDTDGLMWVCVTDGDGNVESCEHKFVEYDY